MAAFTPSPLEQLAWDAAQARDASLSGQRARKRRDGVVHTPPELARFVARALDDLLRNELGLARGLHDGRVRVIDPACGPGSFLASALSLDSAAGPAQCELIGIDRDRAALTHARKLAAHARREGSHVSLVHADTLRAARLPARLQAPPRVLALIGNPPWTVSAAEPSRAMQALLEDFRRDEHGERLRERKLGVLADAYVRFMRWAAELARNNPQGAALGLVTNGSFLDGPVHRGMRAALARWFDVAYLIDLGGSALLARERGGHPRDGNVFGVRPSVAISLWLRRPGPDSERRCHTRYSRVWGTKDEKLAGLADARLASLPWTDVHSTEPGARWLPRMHGRSSPYAEWPSLADCMPFHREGVQTNRDDAVIDRDPQRLLDRLRAFVAGRRTAELAAAQARLRHYDPKRARAAVAAALEADPDGTRGVALRRIAYRPFDVRWFCPVPLFCHRPRPDLLAAFEHAPFALVSVRKDRGTAAYAHFAAVTLPIDNCFLSARSSCRARAFPLRAPDGSINLAPLVSERLARMDVDVDDEARAFACYALAVIAAPSYRERFASDLHADYPRIPWPDTRARFERLVAIGERLVDLFTAFEPAAPPLSGKHASSSGYAIGHHSLSAGPRVEGLRTTCADAAGALAGLLDSRLKTRSVPPPITPQGDIG